MTIDHGIRAILFDLDGVLVNTNDWHVRAFDMSLRLHGIDEMRSDEREIYSGLSTPEMVAYLVGKSRVCHRKSLHDSLMSAKNFFVSVIITDECKPCDRIKGVIAKARELGLKIGVVTNIGCELAHFTLEKAELCDFDVIITRDDVGDKYKPHPKPYCLANMKLELASKQSLAIDDSGRGIISAVDAMCRTWWLKRYEDLTANNLVHVLNNYRITI